MDPFAVLGVTPTASERELASAYRELAKQWHPDRRGADGLARMAEINAAYELLRAGAHHERFTRPQAAAPVRPGRGTWLSVAVRRALGPELLEALSQDEGVRVVTPASTWTSPRTILALTDRRLLWLLDDAPVARVRSLPFRDVVAVDVALRRPRRRVATVTVRSLSGRRFSFTDLRPHTAATIADHVRGASPRAASSARAAD